MKQGYFSKKLVEWYETHKRDLPWRNTQDPYKIWLSEIILQQTRVIQGLPYYERFIKSYPNVKTLAGAKVQEVLRKWQGLGYYSRARNLHKCAQFVAQKMSGDLPGSFTELRQLPGIGDYTAAAIASIAFDEPVAVVDGNVYRVLSRIFGIEKDISSAAGKKYFLLLANQLVTKSQPGIHNQALMEFGALHCLPQNPKCDNCIFKRNCFAFQHEQQGVLPLKSRKPKVTKRYFYYFLIRRRGKILMHVRNGRDIWRGLYDFPALETLKPVPPGKVIEKVFGQGKVSKDIRYEFKLSMHYKHVLTHQIIHARFIEITTTTGLKLPDSIFSSDVKWLSDKQVENAPKPVLITRYLEDRIKLSESERFGIFVPRQTGKPSRES